MRRMIFCIIICVANLPAAALDYKDFPHELQQVLDERIAELDPNAMCVAGRVSMSDEAKIRGGEGVMVNLYGGIDMPLWVYADGWFIMERSFPTAYGGRNSKIVLRAFGYEPQDVVVTFLQGEITYLELVMQKVSEEDLASISGVVVDDQNVPFEGGCVRVMFPFANHGYRGDTGTTFPDKWMITGSDGKFSFEGLSPGEHSVTASAARYAYHHVGIKLSAGEAATRTMKLYPDCRIVIDYVYQADGNTTFVDGDIQTGTLKWANGHEGVDFSDGKVEGCESQSLRDIDMRQEQGVLKFYVFYVGRYSNGFYDEGEVPFESVTDAAGNGYSTAPEPCIVGHVYVVRTYEGNYARFIVRSITGGD